MSHNTKLDFEEDNIEDTNKIVENLWPLFSNEIKDKNSVLGQVLASGGTGYQKPIKNPNSASEKLIPWPLPRSTKCNYKKNFHQAVGKNNKIMTNWMKKPVAITQPEASNTDQPNVNILPCCEGVTAHISSESLECQLAKQMASYLSSPVEISSKSKKEAAANIK
jgi:hypothetical protein